jgi:hypothetical protein
MARAIRGLVACALACAVVAGLASTAAGAKPADGCKLLTPEELEPVFERPFALGIPVAGGACAFRRHPEATRFDMVVVRVLAEKYATVAKARAAFKRASQLTTELALVTTPVDGVGDQAFASYLIGADELTLRVGKTIVELRVNNEDDDEARYALQVIAVGTAAAGHVASPVVTTTTTTAPPEGTPSTTRPRGSTTTTSATRAA